jgi:hypothetical protein
MADVPERFSGNRDDRRSIDRESSPNQAEKNAWRSLIAGMRFVLRRKVFLATNQAGGFDTSNNRRVPKYRHRAPVCPHIGNRFPCQWTEKG